MQDKKQIRLFLKHRRNELSKSEVGLLSGEICGILQEQPCFQNAGKICFYYPLGNEVNLLPLAAIALTLGKQISFPRVCGDDMEFYQVHGLAEFVPGAFSIMEPAGNERVNVEQGLVFVPGLAFDAEGGRIGYGKGYYDRYFARYPECCKIGICYAMQVVSKVPCDHHDMRMDCVATELGVSQIFC